MKHFKVLPWLAAAGPVAAATPSSTGSCSDDAIAMYMPLSNSAAAQSFCSQHIPSPATVTTCATGNAIKRQAPGWDSRLGPVDDPPAGYPPPEDSTLSSIVPTQSQSPDQEQLLRMLAHQDLSTVSAICACIAPSSSPQTVTISCRDGEICDASGSCTIERDCYNPARCDASSFCGTGSTGVNMFCHQDTDDAASGYCMDDGPAGHGCPEDYEDCSSNAECGGKRVCIFSCCREAPFCVDVHDYQSAYAAVPAKMSKTRRAGQAVHPLEVP